MNTALVPQLTPWDDQTVPVYRIADEFCTPLRWEEDFDTYRIKAEAAECLLPYNKSFLDISPSNIVLSAFKQAEILEDETLILRV